MSVYDHWSEPRRASGMSEHIPIAEEGAHAEYSYDVVLFTIRNMVSADMFVE